jgi:PAS domain S-box-containing protein
MWDKGQCRIFGVDPATFNVTPEAIKSLIFPDDLFQIRKARREFAKGARTFESEFRIRRPDGEVRWCLGTAAASVDQNQRLVRVSGVTVDITERKQIEQRQSLLTREVDHRAKNALAVVQSIVRLTRGETVENYAGAIEGRIAALARVHTILSLSSWQGAKIGKLIAEELGPYCVGDEKQADFEGPEVELQPATAQTLALVLHELATNAIKYGALSSSSGRLKLVWELTQNDLEIEWQEKGGPLVNEPSFKGFGTRSVIASIEAQLGGRAIFDWLPEGLYCRLSLPMKINRGQRTVALKRRAASS